MSENEKSGVTEELRSLLEKRKRRRKIRNIVLGVFFSVLAVVVGVASANIWNIIKNPRSAFDTGPNSGFSSENNSIDGLDDFVPDDDMQPDGLDDWASEEIDEEDLETEGMTEESIFGEVGENQEGTATSLPGEDPNQAGAILSPSPSPSPEELLIANSDLEFMKDRLNILLLGLDRSPERLNEANFRTDTMMLVSIDFESKSVDMISIPRDSYVKIYGKSARAKINTAFGEGGGVNDPEKGHEYAAKTVSALFGGIPIHHTVSFDMEAVKKIINVIGGIQYDVDIKVNMNGRTLNIGKQTLDGQGVLDYCRMRKGSSDIARVDRQQRMLIAIVEQVRNDQQWAKLPALYRTISENIDTRLNISQITSLALFGSGLNPDNIRRHIVPGEFVTLNSTSYWGISNNKLRNLINQVFGLKNPKMDSGSDISAVKKVLDDNKGKKVTPKVQPTSAPTSISSDVVAENTPSANPDQELIQQQTPEPTIQPSEPTIIPTIEPEETFSQEDVIDIFQISEE